MIPVRRWLRPPAAAVVIPVPEAAALAGHTDPGMPPHVTLLWPFARRPGRRHRRGLAAIAAAHEQFAFTLVRVSTFPNVVYLAPEPAQPFIDLVHALTNRWPRHQPYGGAFPDVVPHLTVRVGGEPLADDERARLEAALPIRSSAREILLLAPEGEGWRELYRVPLRATTSA
ncbi:MAG: 2'-5' RNA ligase family protein [Frankiaceae bacterium]|nr:2'-5' RNA ligase family protein [Frankiaceae bacterium]MBV9368869.1 2'-5' RNA ligase family protein [Frankiales bacterium]